MNNFGTEGELASERWVIFTGGRHPIRSVDLDWSYNERKEVLVVGSWIGVCMGGIHMHATEHPHSVVESPERYPCSGTGHFYRLTSFVAQHPLSRCTMAIGSSAAYTGELLLKSLYSSGFTVTRRERRCQPATFPYANDLPPVQQSLTSTSSWPQPSHLFDQPGVPGRLLVARSRQIRIPCWSRPSQDASSSASYYSKPHVQLEGYVLSLWRSYIH